MTAGEALRYDRAKAVAKNLDLRLCPSEQFDEFVISDEKEGSPRCEADNVYNYKTLDQVEAFLAGADYIELQRNSKALVEK